MNAVPTYEPQKESELTLLWRHCKHGHKKQWRNMTLDQLKEEINEYKTPDDKFDLDSDTLMDLERWHTNHHNGYGTVMQHIVGPYKHV